jgi:hypothetical protein
MGINGLSLEPIDFRITIARMSRVRRNESISAHVIFSLDTEGISNNWAKPSVITSLTTFVSTGSQKSDAILNAFESKNEDNNVPISIN